MKIKNDAAVYCNILVTKKQTNQTNSIIQARKIFEKKIDTSKDYIRQHKESLNSTTDDADLSNFEKWVQRSMAKRK